MEGGLEDLVPVGSYLNWWSMENAADRPPEWQVAFVLGWTSGKMKILSGEKNRNRRLLFGFMC